MLPARFALSSAGAGRTISPSPCLSRCSRAHTDRSATSYDGRQEHRPGTCVARPMTVLMIVLRQGNRVKSYHQNRPVAARDPGLTSQPLLQTPRDCAAASPAPWSAGAPVIEGTDGGPPVSELSGAPLLQTEPMGRQRWGGDRWVSRNPSRQLMAGNAATGWRGQWTGRGGGRFNGRNQLPATQPWTRRPIQPDSTRVPAPSPAFPLVETPPSHPWYPSAYETGLTPMPMLLQPVPGCFCGPCLYACHILSIQAMYASGPMLHTPSTPSPLVAQPPPEIQPQAQVHVRDGLPHAFLPHTPHPWTHEHNGI